MILLADVNVSLLVVAELRASGLETVRVGDVLHIRAADEEIVGEAFRQGAVILSRDQDFSAILATTGASRPSLINLRTAEIDPARLAARITAAVQTLNSELTSGAIVTIDDGGVRVHSLPIA